jgi:hypothetical protein
MGAMPRDVREETRRGPGTAVPAVTRAVPGVRAAGGRYAVTWVTTG